MTPSAVNCPRVTTVTAVQRGLTLVELLVVIAIIGVLVGMLLPAVQSTREASRRNVCQTNLKQLSLGSVQHEQAFGFLPTGGWAFNLLPFVEQEEIRNQGVGIQDAQAKADQAVVRLTTPLSIFTCPTRRPLTVWAVTPGREFRVVSVPAVVSRRIDAVVRGDYAANMGSGAAPYIYQSGGSPSSIEDGDATSDENWINYWFDAYSPPRAPDGVIFRRSMIRVQHITDGTSKTYLLGEKYLDPALLASGSDQGDDQCLYSGHDRDVLRVGFVPPHRDTRGFDPYDSYPIEPMIHQRLASRNDAEP